MPVHKHCTNDAIQVLLQFFAQGLGFVMPKSENPADWFMDLISGEALEKKCTSKGAEGG